MGDALGIMLVTPLILVWRRMPDGWLEPKRAAEAALVFGMTLLAGQILSGMVISHFGLLGSPVQPLGLKSIIGALIMVGGVVLATL